MCRTAVWLAAVALLCASVASGANVPFSWSFAGAAQSITVNCGDTLQVTQAAGVPHSFTEISTGSCSSGAWVMDWIPTTTAGGTTAITFNKLGSSFYKCAVGSHCSSGGMLLTVNVVGTCGGAATASPSPPPPAASPSPASAPPAPTLPGTVVPWVWAATSGYAALTVPCKGIVSYTWSSGFHDVVQVGSGTCGSPEIKTFAPAAAAGNASIYFAYPGDYYYECTITGHCPTGKMIQKVTVGACAAPGVIDWAFVPNARYAPVTVDCGSSLTFKWNSTSTWHNLEQVASDSCTAPDVALIANYSRAGDVPIKFSKPGTYHYRCDAAPPLVGADHCAVGNMLVTVVVRDNCPASPPPPAIASPRPSPSMASPRPARSPPPSPKKAKRPPGKKAKRPPGKKVKKPPPPRRQG